jgi:predicted glycosyltransferase involved in capsule biosynthesis
MISFIVHLRKDSEERVKNTNIVIPYFHSLISDCEFILVEDDTESNLNFLQQDSVKYYHLTNTGTYNKCRSYNYGLTKATKDIVCFLDIDCIISEENLLLSIKQATNNTGIFIGYNRTCMYFNYNVKNQIKTYKNLYEFLDSFVDKNNIYTLFKNNNYTITNTKAVGGCLMGKKKTFESMNGFNPNFKGWGYEDDEIISRARILEIPVYAINSAKPFLFHLPHDTDLHRDKSDHTFYKHNHAEVSKVEAMNKQQLTDYIKTW